MPLIVRVRQVRLADPLDLFLERGVALESQPQFLPILHRPSRDDVINGGQGELLVVQMPVFHLFSSLSSHEPILCGPDAPSKRRSGSGSPR